VTGFTYFSTVTEAHNRKGEMNMNITGILLLGIVVFLADALMSRKRTANGG
jgi:hypothetical protein